jgi:lambda family phage portal protein
MNALDRAISFVSPTWGLQRARARMGLRAAERFSYDGAKRDRSSSGWIAGNTDANVELSGSLILLRDRSRDLIRNNRYASKALEELVSHTVGTGIMPRAKTGDASLDKIIDAEWPYFAEHCDPVNELDFYGLQALAMRTTAESGEAIARFLPKARGLRVPLQLALLEPDYLDSFRSGQTTAGGGHILQGVEFGAAPFYPRVAYWLFSNHPGGLLLWNPRGGIVSEPVPASEVLHTRRVLRPGQVRGVPWLSPVMRALKDLDDYQDAERIRKKIEACIAAFVTQPEGISGPPIGNASVDPQTGERVESFSPGMIEYMKPGSDVKFNNPPAGITGAYREYTMNDLQGIAAGIGITYELISGDMSNVNYSSYRAGNLSFRATIEAYRWLTLIPMFCNPVWHRFIDTLVLTGKIKQALYGVQWTAPKWESVDPYKDAHGELVKIRSGTLTLSEAIAQNGYDPAEQLEQYAATNKILDDKKIILDSDPRYTNQRGAGQPDNTDTPGANGPVKPGAGKAQPASKGAGKDGGGSDSSQNSANFRAPRAWDSPTRIYGATAPAEEVVEAPVLEPEPIEPIELEPEAEPEWATGLADKFEKLETLMSAPAPPAPPPAAPINLNFGGTRKKTLKITKRDEHGRVLEAETLEDAVVS